MRHIINVISWIICLVSVKYFYNILGILDSVSKWGDDSCIACRSKIINDAKFSFIIMIIAFILFIIFKIIYCC